MTGGTLLGNTAMWGGGLYVNLPPAGVTAVLNNVAITNNWASVSGGGVYAYAGTVTLNGCTFNNNRSGTGVGNGYSWKQGATVTPNNCTINDLNNVVDPTPPPHGGNET
jgi:hypothetical protein